MELRVERRGWSIRGKPKVCRWGNAILRGTTNNCNKAQRFCRLVMTFAEDGFQYCKILRQVDREDYFQSCFYKQTPYFGRLSYCTTVSRTVVESFLSRIITIVLSLQFHSYYAIFRCCTLCKTNVNNAMTH